MIHTCKECGRIEHPKVPGAPCSKCNGTLIPVGSVPQKVPSESMIGVSLDGDTPDRQVIQDPYIGKTVGNFQLIRKLGAGGFGAVYYAMHIHMHEPFAVKVLHSSQMSQPGLVERFRREARALNRLSHENIVRIADFGLIQESGFYLAMELIDGRSIGECIKARESFSLQRLANIARQMCEVLAYIHKKGSLHRDIKPSNIMLVKEENEELLKLIDFGIMMDMDERGGLTAADAIIGTAKFMPPEQARGDRKLGPHADLYSLSVILFLLLTKRLPVNAESSTALLVKKIREPAATLSEKAPRKRWSPHLEHFFVKALAIEPSERHTDASAYWEAFQQALEAQEALGPQEQPRLAPRQSEPTKELSAQDIFPEEATHEEPKTTPSVMPSLPKPERTPAIGPKHSQRGGQELSLPTASGFVSLKQKESSASKEVAPPSAAVIQGIIASTPYSDGNTPVSQVRQQLSLPAPTPSESSFEQPLQPPSQEQSQPLRHPIQPNERRVPALWLALLFCGLTGAGLTWSILAPTSSASHQKTSGDSAQDASLTHTKLPPQPIQTPERKASKPEHTPKAPQRTPKAPKRTPKAAKTSIGANARVAPPPCFQRSKTHLWIQARLLTPRRSIKQLRIDCTKGCKKKRRSYWRTSLCLGLPRKHQTHKVMLRLDGWKTCIHTFHVPKRATYGRLDWKMKRQALSLKYSCHRLHTRLH